MASSPPSPVTAPTKLATAPEAEVNIPTMASQETEPAKPQTEYILDPRGDLWLHTRGLSASGISEASRFRVCSRAVARASPVFDKMLFGAFAEGSNYQEKGQEWVVELPDDPTAAMRPLLHIVHSQYQHMKSVNGTHGETVNNLYDLMVAVDKYDCVALMRPWAASWAVCKGVHTNSAEMFRAAWVLYQLGHKAGYESIVTRLATQFAPSARDFGLFEASVLPPQLLENVRLLRTKLVQSLLDPVRANIQSLLKGSSKPVGLCTEASVGVQDKLACEASMLGDLLRKLHNHNLWPLPDDEKATMGAVTMSATIKSLAMSKPVHPSPSASPGPFSGKGASTSMFSSPSPSPSMFGNSHSSRGTSYAHAGCCSVAPPFVTRAQAGENPWVYSMDYKYQANKEETAHMARQAKLCVVDSQTLFVNEGILFPC
ncbi:BTB/POZ domain-containing protein [Microdochium nivale]|nr:BTB/POZ domain-containing protein [Microdochium nivale]